MKKNKGRKAWRVDLKWLFGVLAVVFLTASLTTFAFYRLASNPQAQILNNNLENKSSNGFGIKLIDGGSKVRIGNKEYSSEKLKKMPEEKLRKIMEEEVKPSDGKKLPDMGLNGNGSKESPDLEALNNMDKMPDFFIDQAAAPILTGLLNGEAKGFFFMMFSTNLIVALFFIVLMIAFSYSWGRLASLGVVFLLSSLPVIIISFVFNIAGTLPPGAKNNSLSSLAAIFAKSNLNIFLIFGVISLLLIVASVFLSLLKRAKPSKSKAIN